MNSKGSNKLISVYWFFVLVLVAGGIVMMVNVFYSSPYDVRIAEGEILSKKIANCVMVGEKMNPELIAANGAFKPAFEDYFMDYCNLNFDVETEYERPQYYVELEIFKSTNLRNSLFSISEGNENWIEDCNFEDSTQEKMAKCLRKEFYTTDGQGNLFLVKILTIVGKTAENVK